MCAKQKQIAIFGLAPCFLIGGSIPFSFITADVDISVKTRIPQLPWRAISISLFLFGDNWSPAFFGALTSVGALFVLPK